MLLSIAIHLILNTCFHLLLNNILSDNEIINFIINLFFFDIFLRDFSMTDDDTLVIRLSIKNDFI